MATSQTFNGVVYSIPAKGDQNWAPPLIRYLTALGTYAFSPAGGTYTLTADLNLGASFGLLAAYYKTSAANLATSGVLRLAVSDTIGWRNNANSANLLLAINGSDQLTFNGGILPVGLGTLADGKIWIGSSGNLPVAQTLTGDVTVTDVGVTAIGAGKIVNSQIANSAAIAYSKLNLSGAIVNADISSSASITYSKLNLTGALQAADIASGQVVKTITGTANQVIASASTDSITLSTPQSIATSSSPTFASLTLSSPLTTANGGTGITASGSASQLLSVSSGGALHYSTLWINVKDYGAVGDDSHDDTTNIQNAINAASLGGVIFFPTSTYKITSALSLPKGISLLGTYHLGQQGGTIIHQSGAANLFTLPDTGGSSEQVAIEIVGFHLKNGTNQLSASNGGVWVTLRNITFDSPTNAGILMQGFIQQWFLRDIECTGGAYGIYLSAAGTGSPALFDKNNFYSCYFNGQSVNGIFLNANFNSADGNVFTNLVLVSASQSGAIFGGGFRALSFINVNSEANGGSSLTASTTATTSAGSANVTVASGTGIANGNTLTIKGAGTNGADWYPVVSSGGGTVNLVMTTTAPTAVTAASCVNNLYSDIEFKANTGSIPANITFLNATLGTITTNGLRYSIDAAAASNVSVINSGFGRPVYDPNVVVMWSGQNTGGQGIRRPSANPNDVYYQSTFGGGSETPRTVIGSPPGTDIVLGLCDSTQNGTGTLGKVEVRKSDGSASKIWEMDSSGNVTQHGTIAMGSHKVTGLSNGTASTDAMAYGQNQYLQNAVQATVTTQVTTTSSTLQAFTSLSATITPTSSSSRIKITVSTVMRTANASNADAIMSIKRGSTDIAASTVGFAVVDNTGTGGVGTTPISVTYIDSPATTSATTYAVFFRNDDNATTVSIGFTGMTSVLIVEELR